MKSDPIILRAIQLHRAGVLDEARALYTEVLRSEPRQIDALHLLGVIHHQRKEYPRAEECYRNALRIHPDFPAALGNIGVLLCETGRPGEAVECLRQSLALEPRQPGVMNTLGMALAALGRLPEAKEIYEAALRLEPASAHVLHNLGNTLRALGQSGEGLALLRRVVGEHPGYAEAQNSLGNALAMHGLLPEARGAYREAHRLKPDYVSPLNNLGKLLREEGKLEEAESLYKQAVALDPESPESHWGLAHVCLLQGRFEEGWREYEWRWALREQQGHWPDTLMRWEGQVLNGRTLLLHAEQGLGDAIQFIRYAPAVAALGARVIVAVPKELSRLFVGIGGVAGVVNSGEEFPPADYHAPLLSLPAILHTREDSVPSRVPYVTIPEEVQRAWSHRLAGDTGGFRIGIAWAGNHKHDNDRNRSCGPDVLASLGNIPGTVVYSLQVNSDRTRDAEPIGFPLIDHTSALSDVMETAGFITQLDLVVTVDSMIAHLAGALGKPVWVLLPFAPDWRWMLGREDSPWYPTMRLFRQKSSGAWSPVVSTVREGIMRELEANSARRADSAAEVSLANALELHKEGLLEDAEKKYRAALSAQPENVDALYLLSVVLFQRGNIEGALHAGLSVLQARPDSSDAHNTVGNCLRSKGDLAAAEGMFRMAVALEPGNADALYNLGSCLCDAWRLAEAEDALLAAAHMNSASGQVWNNLGLVRYRSGRIAEAENDFRRALRLAPDHAAAHFNRAHALLHLGEFGTGWEELEWRWRTRDFQALLHEHPGQRWSSDALPGQAVLVWAEQGFGDAIQFFRYIPLLRSRGVTVLLECPAELGRLAGNLEGVSRVITRGDPLPAYDAQIPLMSLPRAFKTDAATIPAPVPYLSAGKGVVTEWKHRLGNAGAAKRVGVVWGGSATNPAGDYRSIPISSLECLAGIPGIEFVSLQTGPAGGQFSGSGLAARGIDYAPALTDFAETAGAIEQLDLIISIDTSVAHLAGAMGKPVWTLLASPCDWRWGDGSDRTPWYPTMTLYRQRIHGDWAPLIEEVRRDLEAYASTSGSGAGTGDSGRRSFPAFNNLGVALLEARRPAEAIAFLERAVQLSPEDPVAHLNLSLSLLVTGQWEQGLAEFEWRLRTENGRPSLRPYAQPGPDGTSFANKTVYTYAEQGFGDAIQCARYAQLLGSEGARVVVECRQELIRLMAMVPGVSEVVMRGDQAPPFDFHLPMMSLPRLFGTTPASMPVSAPYIRPDPALQIRWSERMAGLRPGPRIGCAWAGNALCVADPDRSVRMTDFLALLSGTSAVPVSLQKGQNPGSPWVDWTGLLEDFADTAALIANLDLVITVDTAVAHLAGAMGKPVWTLIQYAPDWRWLLDRPDTPWYPSMRLFRQQRRNSWEDTFGSVRQALHEWFDRHE